MWYWRPRRSILRVNRVMLWDRPERWNVPGCVLKGGPWLQNPGGHPLLRYEVISLIIIVPWVIIVCLICVLRTGIRWWSRSIQKETHSYKAFLKSMGREERVCHIAMCPGNHQCKKRHNEVKILIIAPFFFHPGAKIWFFSGILFHMGQNHFRMPDKMTG